MVENRALSSPLRLLAEVHYLAFLSRSLCVGDKGLISSKKAKTRQRDKLCVFIERSFVGFLMSSCEILLLQLRYGIRRSLAGMKGFLPAAATQPHALPFTPEHNSERGFGDRWDLLRCIRQL